MVPWDHNAFYHRLLTEQLPTGCGQVLNVGCGSGAFAAQLAERVDHVDALDRSPAMIDRAQRRVPDNVTCVLADVLRAGGTLAAIALPETDLRREWPVELAARITHHALGGFFHAGRVLGLHSPYSTDPADTDMPMDLSPSLTTREVARAAAPRRPSEPVSDFRSVPGTSRSSRCRRQPVARWARCARRGCRSGSRCCPCPGG